MAGPSPSLHDSCTVQILGQVAKHKPTETMTASVKTNPTKEASKKKSSKSSSDNLKTLDEKWFQRFARLGTGRLLKI